MGRPNKPQPTMEEFNELSNHMRSYYRRKYPEMYGKNRKIRNWSIPPIMEEYETMNDYNRFFTRQKFPEMDYSMKRQPNRSVITMEEYLSLECPNEQASYRKKFPEMNYPKKTQIPPTLEEYMELNSRVQFQKRNQFPEMNYPLVGVYKTFQGERPTWEEFQNMTSYQQWYWRKKCGEKLYPKKCDITPTVEQFLRMQSSGQRTYYRKKFPQMGYPAGKLFKKMKKDLVERN